MLVKNKYGLLLLAIFLVANLIGCATVYNPATGQQEMVFVDTNTEINMGKSIAQQAVKSYGGICKDPELTAYVNRVGKRIARLSDRPKLPYQFGVVNSKAFNAFACGGGYIYVTKGLLKEVGNDEEMLAAVLSHEIGHTAARHVAKKIEKNMGYDILSSVLFGSGKQGVKEYKKLVQTVTFLVFQGFSREAEFQADRLGTIYMLYANYDPWGMVRVLEHIEKKRKEPDALQRMTIFMQSHPLPSDRIREVKKTISQMKY